MSTAFLFPGQGSQIVGMGRELYAASNVARAIYDQADAALGFSLTELCFHGPEEALTATENAQPAILTTSVALLAMLAEGEMDAADFVARHASMVAGHSLGEYSALVAAGTLDLQTAVRLVRRRGELMAAATEGAMAAILGLDEAALETICQQVTTVHAPVVIANYNAPGQLVVSGATAAVEHVMAQAKTMGAKRALPLKVSAAFHSPLMHMAAEELIAAVESADFANARTPVISNVTTEPLIEAAAIRQELIAQVTAPVRWIASIQRMVESGIETFVEIGPGNVLTGLIKRIAPGSRLVTISNLAEVQTFHELWNEAAVAKSLQRGQR